MNKQDARDYINNRNIAVYMNCPDCFVDVGPSSPNSAIGSVILHNGTNFELIEKMKSPYKEAIARWRLRRLKPGILAANRNAQGLTNDQN